MDHTTEKLFSYGTLQQEAVQIATFGRTLQGSKEILTGYILSEVEIKDPYVLKTSGKAIHPMLIYTGNAHNQVTGTLFEITPEELLQADEYEVSDYQREAVQFKSGVQGWAYVQSVTAVN